MSIPYEQLSSASLDYLAERCPDERKGLGQYLTPRLLREPLLDRIPLRVGDRVLDPGVGTGEFLLSVRERQPSAQLVGWDVDPQALEVARTVVPDATLIEQSALDVDVSESFDVVIGNPPYFQLKLSPTDRRRFQSVISGRPNIFAVFFHVGLRALKPGGYLGFVVPPSMNNGAYFQALRDFITSQGHVEYLDVYSESRLFEGAQTAVQLIVVRKHGTEDSPAVDLKDDAKDRHVFDLQGVTHGPLHRTVFSEDPSRVREAFDGRSTLWQLGFHAVTGSIVWNQNRNRLRRVPEDGTVPLVWAHNIVDGGVRLIPDHPKRPQYVVQDNPLAGPAIVVNRIVGSVGSGSLRCALVNDGQPFVGENHVNVVLPRPDVEPRVSWDELLTLLSEPGVNEHVVLLTGNTQVSATELTHLLPLNSRETVSPGVEQLSLV